jgi:hypothetical protein
MNLSKINQHLHAHPRGNILERCNGRRNFGAFIPSKVAQGLPGASSELGLTEVAGRSQTRNGRYDGGSL